MRVPEPVSDFFEWRWSPCIGLTAGSLTFVLLALLLIPNQFGEPPAPSERSFAFVPPPAPRALFGASLAKGLPGVGQRLAEETTPEPPMMPPPAVTRAPPPRGFSPIVERPAPPPPPPPPPPAMVPLSIPPPPPVAAVAPAPPEVGAAPAQPEAVGPQVPGP